MINAVHEKETADRVTVSRGALIKILIPGKISLGPDCEAFLFFFLENLIPPDLFMHSCCFRLRDEQAR